MSNKKNIDSKEFVEIDKKPYLPSLYYKTHDNLWRNANQQSTYELCIHVKRYFNNGKCSGDEDYLWVQKIYDIIRSHPNKYGALAGLNNWCHHFTDEQLQNFYTLVENED
tara:strand:+ start:1986 stop:2315 length:330 start_codon:yes stop_codon:yes gene_type:complete